MSQVTGRRSKVFIPSEEKTKGLKEQKTTRSTVGGKAGKPFDRLTAVGVGNLVRIPCLFVAERRFVPIRVYSWERKNRNSFFDSLDLRNDLPRLGRRIAGEP